MNVVVLGVRETDFGEWLAMAAELWPDHTKVELDETLRDVVTSPLQTAFIAVDDVGAPAGFAIISIRHDYVEGSNSSPVGYVEGIYVRAAYRRGGIGGMLLRAGEEWAREQGCSQMGSDADIDNTLSHSFHRDAGFTEAGRAVHFIKEL